MDGEEGEGGKTGRGRPAKVKRAGGRPAVTGMCDVWLRGTWTEGATATRENMAALARAREDAAAAARWKAKAEAEKARAERAEERRRALLWETHASERGTRHALVEASELVSSAQRAAAGRLLRSTASFTWHTCLATVRHGLRSTNGNMICGHYHRVCW